MGSNRNRYSEEFKQNIFNLYKSGKKISEIVSEYGVSKTTVNLWIKERGELKSEGVGLGITSLEYRAMQKEMKEIKEENEILKKAMTIFAKR